MQLALHYVRNSSILSTIIGISLLFLCGQISIPLNPVPMSLQSAAVLFIGLTYTKADALKSICSYLVLGAMGAPIFANWSGGFHKIMGPTGGYLIGFLAAIWVMCTLRERIENLKAKEMVLVSLIGNAMIYAIGLPWLSAFTGWELAISVGLMPFILPGIVKAILVAFTVRYVKK